MNGYVTLADMIKDHDDLPDYLDFEVDEEKDADRIYESIFEESENRLYEARETRTIMRKFLSSHPEEEWTWENFKNENQEFLKNTENFRQGEFNRELYLVRKGVYKVYDPDQVKTIDVENADSRPEFDPADPEADPVMKAIYGALNVANAETDSVEQSVNDKYEELYETARNIANASSTNPHAFICGEAGVGKCASYDTVIPISVDDIVAEEIARWLDSQTYNISKVEGHSVLNLEIGKLFDFLKDKYNVDFEYDRVVNVPIQINVKDDTDNWVSISNLVRKRDSLYETKFDNGVSIKTAAKHIVTFNPDLDLHKYTEDITVGDRLEYLNTSVTENKKVSEAEDVFGFQVNTDKHVYKDANGIIHHNTHTVEKGVEKGLTEWSPTAKHKHKPTFVSHSGSIGTSFTDLLIFFFKNRHEKLILLDDCDSFLVGGNQSIANFMKVLLNTTLKPITTPNAIRNNANASLEKENESVKIKVDTTRLLEGKCFVSVNDETIDCDIDLKEAARLKHAFGFKKALREKKHYTPLQTVEKYVDGLNLFSEAEETLTPEEQAAFEAVEQAGQELGLGNEELEDNSFIPDEWIFDSNLVLISNLKIRQIDEAVISRCDVVELKLTTPEFFCRCEQILDKLKVGEYSSTNQEVIQWAKKEAFAILKLVVLGTQKFKNIYVPVNTHLDFRFVGNKVTNKFLARANRYARENGLDLADAEAKVKVEAAVRDAFIRDLLRLLKGESDS